MLYKNERHFQREFVKYVELFGWLVYFVPDSRMCRSGFPDIVLLRPGRLVIVELKMPGNNTSPEQKLWLKLFSMIPGVETYVWWPDDIPIIKARLGKPYLADYKRLKAIKERRNQRRNGNRLTK
jgi:hypothetical protein